MSGIRTNAAAELLGVSPNTLRSWERRFGYPKPRRTAGGHRQYDLTELESLRRALLETHNISSAIEVARQRGEGPSSPSRLLDAFDRFDEDSANRVMEESLAVRSVERTVEEVLLPGLELAYGRDGREAEYELALRWATGWLHASRRVVPPASRDQGVLLFDSSRALEIESLQVQALELAIRRAGFRSLLLSFDLQPERVARAMRALDPMAFVFCGGGADLEVVGPARLHGAPGRLGRAGVRVPRVDAGHRRPLDPDARLGAQRGRRAAARLRGHRTHRAGRGGAGRGDGRSRPACASPRRSSRRSLRARLYAAPVPLEPGDPLAHRALEALLRAETSVRRALAAELEREGVSAAGFSELVVLFTAGGSLELRALRRRLGWSKANATEVTGTLEARGLVARRRLRSDRRAALVELTPAGVELVERLFPEPHPPRLERLRRSRRAGEALARRHLPQAGRLGVLEFGRGPLLAGRLESVASPPSRRRCSSAGASATSSTSRSGGGRAVSATSSTRARRRPTGAPARTTCWRARSRTSSRASRRCAGYLVERKAGWDCHGLPVELEVERELGIKSKDDIERYGDGRVQRQVPRVGAALHRRVGPR